MGSSIAKIALAHCFEMSQHSYRVRRATLDDLPWLISLWHSMHLSAPDLERRLTEFQVVESDGEELLGALAMEVTGRYGRLHSETFSDFGLSQHLRELLWHRFQSVAASLGLTRIWLNDSVPFWKQNGFQPADAATLAKLPAAWSVHAGPWLTLELRSEEALRAAIETDFTRLKIEEAAKTNSALGTAKVLKVLSSIVIGIIICGIIYFCIFLLRNLPYIMHRLQGNSQGMN